jgi:hypothetical protein
MPAKKYATKEDRAAAANARKRERYASDASYREKVKDGMRKPHVRAADAARKAAKRASSPEECRQYQREYERSRRNSDPSFREKKNVWRRNARASDDQFRLAENMRRRLNHAVAGLGVKSASAIELVGCTLVEFRAYIESQWKPGMSWDNWTVDGWHVDHIRPLASFDLADPAQQKAAFHYTNCQPLWAAENLSKNAKWEAA